MNYTHCCILDQLQVLNACQKQPYLKCKVQLSNDSWVIGSKSRTFQNKNRDIGCKGPFDGGFLSRSYESKKILKLHTKSIKGSATRFRVNGGKILGQSWGLKLQPLDFIMVEMKSVLPDQDSHRIQLNTRTLMASYGRLEAKLFRSRQLLPGFQN